MLIKLSLVALCVINVAVGYNSPVLLWGVKSDSRPALETVSQNAFTDIIAPFLKSHMIVVFNEELLSTKDFLCSNPQTAQSCFAFLAGVPQKTYYSSVNNPTEAIRSLVSTRDLKTISTSEKDALTCAPGLAVFVNFDETQEQPGETFVLHDSLIKTITTDLKSCPVVFIYTSAPSYPLPSSRNRRSVDQATGGIYFRATNQFLIYYTDLLYTKNGITTSISIQNFSTQNSSNILNITMTDNENKDLKFGVVASGGYFSLTGITYDGLSFPSGNINAPTTFSYFCGNLTLAAVSSADNPVTAILQWNSFQIQAPFDSTYSNTFSFGDPWYCVGFFTPGILMGLFVVILLLAITFTGIAWMMDINTMDRFDDPKGKTITVNAAE